MNRFVVKGLFLLISFFCVVYTIKSINSGSLEKSLNDPKNPLALLIGSDNQPTNWCPPEVETIQMWDVQGQLVKTFSFAIEFSVVCEIMVSPTQVVDSEKSSFSKYLTARGKNNGEEITINANSSRDAFELKGYYFKSPMLLKSIERVIKE